jgi:hypothetical protein
MVFVESHLSGFIHGEIPAGLEHFPGTGFWGRAAGFQMTIQTAFVPKAIIAPYTDKYFLFFSNFDRKMVSEKMLFELGLCVKFLRTKLTRDRENRPRVAYWNLSMEFIDMPMEV